MTDAGQPPKKASAFVRLPNVYIGKLAQRGACMPAALKMLAIKIARGDNLNEIKLHKDYGVSRREFQSGLRTLQEAGIIQNRKQAKRVGVKLYAVEELSRAQGGYVLIPVGLLKRPAKQLALVAIALLSPRPVLLSVAAQRIGIRNSTTRTKLLSAIKDVSAVQLYRGPRGSRYIGRRGLKLEPKIQIAKIDPAKFVPAKNDAAHLLMITSHLTRKEINPDGRQRDTICFAKSSTPVCLTDWATSVVDEKSPDYSPLELALGDWLALVQQAGAHLPSHLLTQHAADQVASAAGYLLAIAENDNESDAVRVIALALDDAVKRGRKIYSLGFIVKRLIGFARQQELADLYTTDRMSIWNK
jgi:hypothetical protein